MTRRQRLRRLGILCCHCLRNLAFYRAWYQVGKPRSDEQFWVTANGNFLDVAILEWCKLFGDLRGKHHWSKVVSDPDVFKAGLLQHLEATDTVLQIYIVEMRTYRDKFVAHLDDELQMQIPKLTIAMRSTIYLYNYLCANEDEGDAFHDGPANANAFYRRLLADAKLVYDE